MTPIESFFATFRGQPLDSLKEQHFQLLNGNGLVHHLFHLKIFKISSGFTFLTALLRKMLYNNVFEFHRFVFFLEAFNLTWNLIEASPTASK